MPENPNQPRDDDAVLGGQNPAPFGSVVLGGLEGVKMRLAIAPTVEQKVAALSEALKYGLAGLDLVIQALQDSSQQVCDAASSLLQKQRHPKADLALRAYRVQQLPKRYAAGERDFKNLDFYGAKLSQTNLSQSNLSEANLRGADLRQADLSRALVRGTDLSRADLNRADLSRADLYGANLSRAKLNDANLSRANLSWANLSDANLMGANLSDVNLSDANLSDANLSGANLSSAKLSGADLSGAIYNAETRFTKGFSPKNSGAVYSN